MSINSSAPDSLDRYTVRLDGPHVHDHTFLLGNRGGFILYLPAARNVRDRTLHSIKWFGASGFGRTFLEGFAVWVEVDGHPIALNRTVQTALEVRLDGVVRAYQVEGHEVQETFFVPDGLQAVVWSLQTNLPSSVRPEFDMRYYQAFNTDFSRYGADMHGSDLLVCNRVEGVGASAVEMQFFGLVGTLDGGGRIELVPPEKRLLDKTYLKDEARDKLIVSAYRETLAKSPDEAPIWDVYSNKVYAPALFHLQGPSTLVCSFGDCEEEATGGLAAVRHNLPALRRQKREEIDRQLEDAAFETGNKDVDTAYAHVLTRFDDALVARDATLHVEPVHREHYYAIFAGDKYFMDAWKRDENISLEALLATNDYKTVRRILDDTWQFQDKRTGRLPHIIRVGEPLVYFSSDGTLWALQRLFEYTRDSGDRTLLAEKMPMVETFFSASMDFVQRGLLPSGGIIDKAYLWETWEDTPYTPRAGYPVEIELLWLTVLDELLPFVRDSNVSLAGAMARTLEEGRVTFTQFVCDRQYLADSLTYGWDPQCQLTPNGYIAFGLRYPLPPGLEHAMVLLGRDQLAGHRGVRSLAPRDWASTFPAAFLADPHIIHGHDMASVGIFNYHRGIEWEWLNTFFVAGELACGRTDEAYCAYLKGQVHEALGDVGVGGLSELHDRQGQVGADFQAWSMAGFIDGLHRFAGVQVDALAKSVRIRPSIPSEWPSLRCRRRVAGTRFELRYAVTKGGQHHVEVCLLDPAPPGYTLHLGLRVPPGQRVVKSSCNGSALPDRAWEYGPPCAAGVAGEAWTAHPMVGDLTLDAHLG